MSNSKKKQKPPRHDRVHIPVEGLAETKAHVMKAGREVLLAAKGMLNFCSAYVQTNMPEASRPKLVEFFKKASSVASELEGGLDKACAMKDFLGDAAKDILKKAETEFEMFTSGSKSKKTRQNKR